MAARRKAARGKQTARKKKAVRKARRTPTKRAGGRRKRAPAAVAAPSGTFAEVEELARLMEAHGLLEVDFESSPDGTRRLRVSRVGAGASSASPAGTPEGAAVPVAATAPPTPDVAPPDSADDGSRAFDSPMVGTFYRAPSPEMPSFVNVGDHVDEQTTLCIIEAMKVMNEITPDIAGVIVSIEVENGEAVEYGQPLFLIRPS